MSRKHHHPVVVVLLLPAAAIALAAHSCSGPSALVQRGAALVERARREVPRPPARTVARPLPRIETLPNPNVVVRPRTHWSI